MNNIQKPVNAEERLMYEQLIRLDALCSMMSSLIEHIAKKEGVATTSNEVIEEKPKPRKRTRKKATEDVKE